MPQGIIQDMEPLDQLRFVEQSRTRSSRPNAGYCTQGYGTFYGAKNFVVDFASLPNNVHIGRIVQVIEPRKSAVDNEAGQGDKTSDEGVQRSRLHPPFAGAQDFNIYLIPLPNDIQAVESEDPVVTVLREMKVGGAMTSWLDLYPPGAFNGAQDFVINTEGPTNAGAFYGARDFVAYTKGPTNAGAFGAASDFVVNTKEPTNVGAFHGAHDFVVNTEGPTNTGAFYGAHDFVVNTKGLSNAWAFYRAHDFVVNTNGPTSAGTFDSAYNFVVSAKGFTNAGVLNGAHHCEININGPTDTVALNGAHHCTINVNGPINVIDVNGTHNHVRSVLGDSTLAFYQAHNRRLSVRGWSNTIHFYSLRSQMIEEGPIRAGAFKGIHNFTISITQPIEAGAFKEAYDFVINAKGPINAGAFDGARDFEIRTDGPINAGAFDGAYNFEIRTRGPINAGALDGAHDFEIRTEGPINAGALDGAYDFDIRAKGPVNAGAFDGAYDFDIRTKGPINAGALDGARDFTMTMARKDNVPIERIVAAIESGNSVIAVLQYQTTACAEIDWFHPSGLFNGARHFYIHHAPVPDSVQTGRISKAIDTVDSGNYSDAKWSVHSDGLSVITIPAKCNPPSKCHPSTRIQLRNRIKEWWEDETRQMNMLWLLGPARSGKSAIAQTVGEEYKASKGPFASFFFSRLGRRGDPSVVIPTLVLQLMTQIPEYKHLITERFAADPNFPKRNLETQFKELIVDPFRTLHSSKPFECPVLIILDGLDECNSKEAQCEFINLITDHAHLRTNSPLIWLVCSRPEWHLKRMFSDADFSVQCRREEVSVDDEESKADVLLVLRDGLQDIQHRFSDRLPKTWPGEEAVTKIAGGSFNLFTVVTTIVRFIGDENIANPDGRLQECLEFMENDTSFLTAGENPVFDVLESLYGSVFPHVPSANLPAVLRILFLRILYPCADLCVSLHANVLGLTQSVFYGVLEGMHSVLLIPPLEYADKYGIQPYNSSFEKYLKDPSQTLIWNSAYCDILLTCLRWLKPLTSQTCILEGDKKCHVPLPPLTWPSDLDEWVVFNRIRSIVVRLAWDACCQISDPSTISTALQACRDFDFRHLGASMSDAQHLAPFLNWLHNVDTDGLVLGRASTQPKAEVTCCLGSEPTDMFPLDLTLCRLEFVSNHASNMASERRQSDVFSLGSGTGACLVCILPNVSKIVGFVKEITSSPDKYRVLLEKQGTDAQKIIDIFQEVLDSQELQSDDTHHSAILQALLRLVGQSRLYPRQLILEGVTQEDQPVVRGGFGEVSKGKYQHRWQVCIKTLIIATQQTQMTELLAASSREAVLWSQLRHPNLLPFYGVFCGEGRIGLVSPWILNGNMVDYLKSNPKSSRIELVHDMFAGLSCLHRRNIVHGDLKGNNVLIRPDGSACLTDFGLSTVADLGGLPFSSYQSQKKAGGNVRWMAPEVLEADVRRTFQSDIYSLASLMLETFTGNVPYPHIRQDYAIIWNLLQGTLPERPDEKAAPELTDPIWKIMKKSWSKEPTDRPTIEQIVEEMTACAPPQGQRVVEEWNIPHTRKYELSYSDATFLKTTFNL